MTRKQYTKISGDGEAVLCQEPPLPRGFIFHRPQRVLCTPDLAAEYTGKGVHYHES